MAWKRPRRRAVPRVVQHRCLRGGANPSRRRGQLAAYRGSKGSGIPAPTAPGGAEGGPRGQRGGPTRDVVSSWSVSRPPVPPALPVSKAARERGWDCGAASRYRAPPSAPPLPGPPLPAPPVAPPHRIPPDLPSPSPAATSSPRRPRETETRAWGQRAVGDGSQTAAAPHVPAGPLRGGSGGSGQSSSPVPRSEAVPAPGGGAVPAGGAPRVGPAARRPGAEWASAARSTRDEARGRLSWTCPPTSHTHTPAAGSSPLRSSKPRGSGCRRPPRSRVGDPTVGVAPRIRLRLLSGKRDRGCLAPGLCSGCRLPPAGRRVTRGGDSEAGAAAGDHLPLPEHLPSPARDAARGRP